MIIEQLIVLGEQSVIELEDETYRSKGRGGGMAGRARRHGRRVVTLI